MRKIECGPVSRHIESTSSWLNQVVHGGSTYPRHAVTGQQRQNPSVSRMIVMRMVAMGMAVVMIATAIASSTDIEEFH